MKKILAITIAITNLVWIIFFLVAIATTTDKDVLIAGLLVTTQSIINEVYIVLYIINLFKVDDVEEPKNE